MPTIKIVPGGEGSAGFAATVNGIALPVDAYAAEPGDNGQVTVSLIIVADSLQVGIPPARATMPQPEHRNQPPVSTWGDPGRPDPRANIAGWAPPPATADAGRNHTGGHRRVGEHFTAGLGKLIRGGSGRLA